VSGVVPILVKYVTDRAKGVVSQTDAWSVKTVLKELRDFLSLNGLPCV
jgi:hypothetical protein